MSKGMQAQMLSATGTFASAAPVDCDIWQVLSEGSQFKPSTRYTPFKGPPSTIRSWNTFSSIQHDS